MKAKYKWQGKWYRFKDAALERMPTPFPNTEDQITVLTAKELPSAQNVTSYVFDTVADGRAAFAGEQALDIYSRLTEPTVRDLERKITALEAHRLLGLGIDDLVTLTEAAPIGTLGFGCGMAAISHTATALLETGDTIIVDRVLYGCTDNLFNKELKRKGIKVVQVDASNLGKVERAFAENPEAKFIYFETPTNPLMGLRDIGGISRIARPYKSLCLVDSTFATPVFQNPMNFGADVVIHSLTKYMSGHGDKLGGSVTGPALFVYDNEVGGLAGARRLYGGVMDPDQAAALAKGLTTLTLRADRHYQNARIVVDYLKRHPSIKKVYYPGERDNKGIAAAQMSKTGGILSFEVQGTLEDTERMMNRLSEVTIGHLRVSLGQPYTTLEHPAAMTHYFVGRAARQRKGIYDTLVRMSVGLESPAYILKTLEYILDPKEK